jgi:hypothetical protein
VRSGGEVAESRARFEIRSAEGAAREAGNPAPGARQQPVPPVPAELVPVLERAGQYVLEYEQKFQNIVAEETYTQWTSEGNVHSSPDALTLSCVATRCRRTTKADVVFVRLAGAVPWGSFRDVYEVDGNRVREHEARLVQLFSGLPAASAQQRARMLLDDSSRYNIGPALRNINFPTLSLMFLLPQNQARFAWKAGGKRRFGMVETVELEFEELVHPTIVDQSGREDLPARGRLWIDPARGTLLRSETHFRFEPRRARAYVATEYRPEPKLAMWVPDEMREEYEDLAGGHPRVFGAPTEATARYANFRRFSVSVEDERITAPGPAEAPRPGSTP